MADDTPQGYMARDRGGPLKVYPIVTLFVGSAPSEAPHYGCDMLHVLQSMELEVGGLDVRALCGYSEAKRRVTFMPTKLTLLCETCERLVREQK